MGKGYVKLHRKIQDFIFWPNRRAFTKFEAWIDILISVNGVGREQVVKDEKLFVPRGCMVASVRYLAKRWSWSKAKVGRFLTRLKTGTVIETLTETLSGTPVTIIKVLNYDTYNPLDQDSGTATGTLTGTLTGTPTGRRRDKLNKGKESKRKKKSISYTDDFLEFLSHYPKPDTMGSKAQAFRNWKSLLSEGIEPATLIHCAKNYDEFARIKGTERQYLIRPSNFLGRDRRFEEFLPGEYIKPEFEPSTGGQDSHTELLLNFGREGEPNGVD